MLDVITQCDEEASLTELGNQPDWVHEEGGGQNATQHNGTSLA